MAISRENLRAAQAELKARNLARRRGPVPYVPDSPLVRRLRRQVARIKGGPNSVEAAMLIDFLLSEEIERMLADSTSHNIPVRKKIAAEFSQYQVPNPLKVSYQQAANMRERAVAQAMDWLTRKDEQTQQQTQSQDDDAP